MPSHVLPIVYLSLLVTNQVSLRHFSDGKSPADGDIDSSIAQAHDPDVLKSLIANLISRVTNLEADTTSLKKDNISLRADNTSLKKDNIPPGAEITLLKKDNISLGAEITSVKSVNKQQDTLIRSIFDCTHSPILLVIFFRHGYKMLVQARQKSPTPIRLAYVPQTLNTQADLAREVPRVEAEIIARRMQFGSAKHRAHEISGNILKLRHKFKMLGQPWEGPMVWYAAEVSSLCNIRYRLTLLVYECDPSPQLCRSFHQR